MHAGFSQPVSDYMTGDVRSVSADAPVSDAYELLDELGVSSLPVLSEDGKLLGAVSLTDLMRVAKERPAGQEADDTPLFPDREVGSVMSTNLVRVERSTRIVDAADMMMSSGVHRVWVCEHGRLVGVFSTLDIIRAIAEEDVPTPVRRYMSFPVGVVQASDPVSVAIERLTGSPVGAIVVERNGRLVGVFTEIEAAAARFEPPDSPVEHSMDRSLVCLTEDAPLGEAAEEAVDAHVHQVAALRKDGSIGLLTGMDFARVTRQELGETSRTTYGRDAGSTLVMIMAGGRGRRLNPLTSHRAKPAVPFGGRYRIIDFVLSNVVNSGYQRIYVITQYMASSLIRHINQNWPTSTFGQSVEVVPAQMRHGLRWYEGTADSILQNLNLILDAHAENVAILGGDHIYTFAVEQMERAHRDRDADLTVATFPVPVAEAARFGVVVVDRHSRIVGFQEKPKKDPATIPGRPDHCLVSMGNYFFRSHVLQDVLRADAGDPDSSHDFGKDVIPRMVRAGAHVYAYDFATNRIRGQTSAHPSYWRDVGTIDSYFDANMELRSALPELNLYNRRWPIRSAARNYPPARFVRHGGEKASEAADSLICEGCILDSARLDNVVASYDCYFHAGSEVVDSVILSGCDIGAGARLRGVLCDKNCSIEPRTIIGEDSERDRARFPFITERGIIVLPKGTHVPREGAIELSNDIYEMLKQDRASARCLEEVELRPLPAGHNRHSYDSVGPRFQRYGRM